MIPLNSRLQIKQNKRIGFRPIARFFYFTDSIIINTDAEWNEGTFDNCEPLNDKLIITNTAIITAEWLSGIIDLGDVKGYGDVGWEELFEWNYYDNWENLDLIQIRICGRNDETESWSEWFRQPKEGQIKLDNIYRFIKLKLSISLPVAGYQVTVSDLYFNYSLKLNITNDDVISIEPTHVKLEQNLNEFRAGNVQIRLFNKNNKFDEQKMNDIFYESVDNYGKCKIKIGYNTQGTGNFPYPLDNPHPIEDFVCRGIELKEMFGGVIKELNINSKDKIIILTCIDNSDYFSKKATYISTLALDSFVGDGSTTEFILDDIPAEDSVSAKISDNPVFNFTIDYENKKVTFNPAPGNGVDIDISYQVWYVAKWYITLITEILLSEGFEKFKIFNTESITDLHFAFIVAINDFDIIKIKDATTMYLCKSGTQYIYTWTTDDTDPITGFANLEVYADLGAGKAIQNFKLDSSNNIYGYYSSGGNNYFFSKLDGESEVLYSAISFNNTTFYNKINIYILYQGYIFYLEMIGGKVVLSKLELTGAGVRTQIDAYIRMGGKYAENGILQKVGEYFFVLCYAHSSVLVYSGSPHNILEYFLTSFIKVYYYNAGTLLIDTTKLIENTGIGDYESEFPPNEQAREINSTFYNINGNNREFIGFISIKWSKYPSDHLPIWRSYYWEYLFSYNINLKNFTVLWRQCAGNNSSAEYFWKKEYSTNDKELGYKIFYSQTTYRGFGAVSETINRQDNPAGVVLIHPIINAIRRSNMDIDYDGDGMLFLQSGFDAYCIAGYTIREGTLLTNLDFTGMTKWQVLSRIAEIFNCVIYFRGDTFIMQERCDALSSNDVKILSDSLLEIKKIGIDWSKLINVLMATYSGGLKNLSIFDAESLALFGEKKKELNLNYINSDVVASMIARKYLDRFKFPYLKIDADFRFLLFPELNDKYPLINVRYKLFNDFIITEIKQDNNKKKTNLILESKYNPGTFNVPPTLPPINPPYNPVVDNRLAWWKLEDVKEELNDLDLTLHDNIVYSPVRYGNGVYSSTQSNGYLTGTPPVFTDKNKGMIDFWVKARQKSDVINTLWFFSLFLTSNDRIALGVDNYLGGRIYGVFCHNGNTVELIFNMPWNNGDIFYIALGWDSGKTLPGGKSIALYVNKTQVFSFSGDISFSAPLNSLFVLTYEALICMSNEMILDDLVFFDNVDEIINNFPNNYYEGRSPLHS